MILTHIKNAIDNYVDYGHPLGGFLTAVMINDLFEAAGLADEYNKNSLTAICSYIYNYTPATCHGSKLKMEEWFKLHKENPEKAERAAFQDRENRKIFYEVM